MSDLDNTKYRIIGIDPGTRFVGYGIIDVSGSSLRYVASGSIVAKDGTIADRLVTIHTRLQLAIDQYQPYEAAVETVFSGDNVKTALVIGEGRGVAVLSAAERGLSVTSYEPATIKRAVTGNGRASKDQIREMVRILLGLSSLPPTDHEADALALAITHADRKRIAAIAI